MPTIAIQRANYRLLLNEAQSLTGLDAKTINECVRVKTVEHWIKHSEHERVANKLEPVDWLYGIRTWLAELKKLRSSLTAPTVVKRPLSIERKSTRWSTNYKVVGTAEDCKEWSRNLHENWPAPGYGTHTKKVGKTDDGKEVWEGYRSNSCD